MKKQFLLLALFVFAFSLCAASSFAQGGAKNGPDPSTVRDPELEKDSLHNLEVARNYFKLKKAYVAALKRCEEVIASNPNFAKIDEALFIAGESALLLAENKGKQSASLYVSFDGTTKHTFTPPEFREMGRDYLSHLVNDYSQSQFRKQAEDDLQPLGGPKPKSPGKQ